MRVLVYPRKLEIGGAHIVAADLAGAMHERGHEVTVFGVPGPLTEVLEARGVPVIPASPRRTGRSSIRRVRDLRSLARDRDIDVVHCYGPVECTEAFLGPWTFRGTAIVCTQLSGIQPLWDLPREVAMVVGKRYLEAAARESGRNVAFLRPPIDALSDSPSFEDSEFRERHGLDGSLTIVTVSRLVEHLKLEGIIRLIDAVRDLAGGERVRLLIVGGGERFEDLARRCDQANRSVGERAVVMTGPMVDPRAGYAAADVVAGMGTAVLRGMAFAKPAIVLGERGYSEIVTPETVDGFLEHGFFGQGNGSGRNDALRAQLTSLLRDEEERRRLGAFSRSVVLEHFDLRMIAGTVEHVYRRVQGANRPAIGRVAASIRFVSAQTWRRAARLGRAGRAA